MPQNRDRALELFGGNGTPTFWTGILGGQQEGESQLAYLLRTNKLPHRPEDVTPAYVERVTEQDVGSHLQALNTLMEIVNANSQSRGSYHASSGPHLDCSGTLGGSFASHNAVVALGGPSC